MICLVRFPANEMESICCWMDSDRPAVSQWQTQTQDTRWHSIVIKLSLVAVVANLIIAAAIGSELVSTCPVIDTRVRPEIGASESRCSLSQVPSYASILLSWPFLQSLRYISKPQESRRTGVSCYKGRDWLHYRGNDTLMTKDVKRNRRTGEATQDIIEYADNIWKVLSDLFKHLSRLINIEDVVYAPRAQLHVWWT